jgi:hypothetical protein
MQQKHVDRIRQNERRGMMHSIVEKSLQSRRSSAMRNSLQTVES